MEAMKPVDVIILSFNEERHIARAIGSVTSFARAVFVVDSFSTDRTVEVARSLGATVVEHAFVNQAKQFQRALDTLPTSAPWTMRLDADEIVEPALAEEILRKLPGMTPHVVGINLRRKHIFLGRWIRHGGRYPLILLRIWRRGHGRVEDRWMDEHILVEGGRTVVFDHDFVDHNLGDLDAFTKKHVHYATREAVDVLVRRHDLLERNGRRLSAGGVSRQAALKRLVKEQLYNRLPFTWSAPLYFLWRYVFRLGFLDGRSGLVYHFLQGFWYRFLVGARVMELERALGVAEGKVGDKESRLKELEALTGCRLRDKVRCDTRVDVVDQALRAGQGGGS
jgi:glycosyltransferase involved in cell wall biosynthesis